MEISNQNLCEHSERDAHFLAKGVRIMNVRKNIDYSQMYRAIDGVIAQNLPQMQMYAAIGNLVCGRSEKGAAVMASEYIRANHPEVQGFSPRNLRRMRDFWRTYEGYPSLLSLAMQLGWTQNVVIMEADLTMELRDWYLRATWQFGWSKAELSSKIADQAHLELVLEIKHEVCERIKTDGASSLVFCVCAPFTQERFVHRFLMQRYQGIQKERLILWSKFRLRKSIPRRIAVMRCKRYFLSM